MGLQGGVFRRLQLHQVRQFPLKRQGDRSGSVQGLCSFGEREASKRDAGHQTGSVQRMHKYDEAHVPAEFGDAGVV